MNWRWYSKYTIILAGLILTVYAMVQAAAILKLFLFSVFLSILVIPLCDRLEKLKLSRILASILSVLCVIVVLGGILTFFFLQLSSLSSDIKSLKEPIDELLTGIQQFLSNNLGFDGYINFEMIKESTFNYLSNNTEALTKWLGGMISVLTSFVLVPILMFLILIFRDFLKEGVLIIFRKKSEKHRRIAEKIMKNIKIVIQEYVYGLMIIMVILGTVYSVMLYAIGIEYAFFFGSFAGFLSLVPIVGPIVGSIVPTLYALLTMDSLLYPFLIVAGFYVVETIEGNFLTPVILGNQVSLNALAALIFLYVGAQIWGLAGMILFIPIGAILKVTFDEIKSLQGFGYILGRVPPDKFKKSVWARKITDWLKK